MIIDPDLSFQVEVCYAIDRGYRFVIKAKRRRSRGLDQSMIIVIDKIVKKGILEIGERVALQVDRIRAVQKAISEHGQEELS